MEGIREGSVRDSGLSSREAAERRTPIRGEMPGRKVRADSSREAVFVLHVK
jgi:hypothetical protein